MQPAIGMKHKATVLKLSIGDFLSFVDQRGHELENTIFISNKKLEQKKQEISWTMNHGSPQWKKISCTPAAGRDQDLLEGHQPVPVARHEHVPRRAASYATARKRWAKNRKFPE